MIKWHVKIKGTRPLLMHSDQSMLLDRQKSKNKKTIPSPEEEAEKSAYRDESGELYIPSKCVHAALIRAARTYGAARGRGNAVNDVRASVVIEPRNIGLGTSEYEVDLQTVVIQRARIVRARPRLDEWAAEFDVIWNPLIGLKPETMRDVLKDAGAVVGLLDYRPVYGLFEVVSIDEGEI